MEKIIPESGKMTTLTTAMVSTSGPPEKIIGENGKTTNHMLDRAPASMPAGQSTILKNGKMAISTDRAPSRMLMEKSILEGGKMTILTDRTSSSTWENGNVANCTTMF